MEQRIQSLLLVALLLITIGWIIHRERQWQDMGNITKVIATATQQQHDIQIGSIRHQILDIQRNKQLSDRVQEVEKNCNAPCKKRD